MIADGRAGEGAHGVDEEDRNHRAGAAEVRDHRLKCDARFAPSLLVRLRYAQLSPCAPCWSLYERNEIL